MAEVGEHIYRRALTAALRHLFHMDDGPVGKSWSWYHPDFWMWTLIWGSALGGMTLTIPTFAAILREGRLTWADSWWLIAGLAMVAIVPFLLLVGIARLQNLAVERHQPDAYVVATVRSYALEGGISLESSPARVHLSWLLTWSITSAGATLWSGFGRPTPIVRIDRSRVRAVSIHRDYFAGATEISPRQSDMMVFEVLHEGGLPNPIEFPVLSTRWPAWTRRGRSVRAVRERIADLWDLQ